MPGELRSVPPTCVSRQPPASPAQPGPAGKYGVVRPCLCVQGWRSRRCQLSPGQGRGDGEGWEVLPSPMSCTGWRGSEAAREEWRPRAPAKLCKSGGNETNQTVKAVIPIQGRKCCEPPPPSP
ncbi:hypothetical protein MC885_014957, partial [Smutsia gigantea]